MGREREDAARFDAAMKALHHNPYYLAAVAELCRSKEVVVTETVCGAYGMQLLRKGMVLTPDFPQLLEGRALAKPLDHALAVRQPMDLLGLHEVALELLQTHPLGQLIQLRMGAETSLLLELLREMHWPPQAAFKLTVMHAQLPSLFEHSVITALTALYLAVRAQWDSLQSAKLASAALLHDVGMLYMSSSWTDSNYRLNPKERSQLMAHTVTGSMAVQSMGVFPRSVEDAVLEHHECMDGSGYPRRLTGADISPMGRILLLAEVVASFYDKYGLMSADRLSLALRLQAQRYPAEHLPHVFDLLQLDPNRASANFTVEQVVNDCHRVGAVFQYWSSCLKVLPAQWQGMPGARAVMEVQSRMRALEVGLAESGAHPREKAAWLHLLEQDPQSLQELGLIHREVQWQISSCIDTCLRRWPQLADSSSTVERALRIWIESSRKVLQDTHCRTESPPPQTADSGA